MIDTIVAKVNNIQIVKSHVITGCKRISDNGKIKECYKRAKKVYKAVSPSGNELYHHEKYGPVKEYCVNNMLFGRAE